MIYNFYLQVRFVAEILTCLGCILTLVVDCFEIGAQGFWSFLNNCVSKCIV